MPILGGVSLHFFFFQSSRLLQILQCYIYIIMCSVIFLTLFIYICFHIFLWIKSSSASWKMSKRRRTNSRLWATVSVIVCAMHSRLWMLKWGGGGGGQGAYATSLRSNVCIIYYNVCLCILYITHLQQMVFKLLFLHIALMCGYYRQKRWSVCQWSRTSARKSTDLSRAHTLPLCRRVRLSLTWGTREY